MHSFLYRRLPVFSYYVIFFFGAPFGLPYVCPSRLYSLRARIAGVALLAALWWSLLYFHRVEAFNYREAVLFLHLLHYTFSIFYVCCFVNESLTLLPSDIKERKLSILSRWRLQKKSPVLQI
jgi:hypothetical protein